MIANVNGHMPKIYAYGRASTDKQSITLDAQKDLCERHVALQLDLGQEYEYGGWYPDPAASASIFWFERPAGEKLMLDTYPGDAIVVSNFDRAFRNVVDCHNSLVALEAKKVSLTIMDVMGVDTKTPLGKAFMSMIAIMKQMEREEISRRTREVLQYKRRMGKPVNAAKPLGWKKIGTRKNPKLIPCDEDRHWCNLVVKLRDKDNLTNEQIYEAFKKAGIRTDRGGWSHRRISKAYVAAKLDFPKVLQADLPNPRKAGFYGKTVSRGPDSSAFVKCEGPVLAEIVEQVRKQLENVCTY